LIQGAAKRDWLHFQHVLGLAADLLPVVPDKNATPSPMSKVKAFGKIPSAYNSRGEAHGITQWQAREINEDEVEHWSEDRRLSMCLRAGRSGVYAIDVDIDNNPGMADDVDAVIHSNTDTRGWRFAERYRNNSSKTLFAFSLPEDHTLAKRIIDCGDAGRIEFLGLGQQFVCAGSHPSGELYRWRGENDLPADIPNIELAEFERIWAALVERFAVAKVNSAPKSSSFPNSEDDSLRTEISDVEEADLYEALAYKPLLAAAADNDFWSEVGYALLSLGERGAFLFRDFSRSAPNYVVSDDDVWWSTHRDQTPRSDFRHIFTMARRLGWRSTAEPSDFAIVAPRDLDQPVIEPEENLAGTPPEHLYPTTDLANARRLHDHFAGKTVIYGRGCFHEWNGQFWRRDSTAGQRAALQLSLIVRGEAEELKPKVDALIEAASIAELEDFEALREKRRADRAGSALFKKISNTELWRTYATMENLELWAQKCEGDATQAAAARMLKTVMEVL
jgi:Bifunctional DNA primase/polymerase, N-terminal